MSKQYDIFFFFSFGDVIVWRCKPDDKFSVNWEIFVSVFIIFKNFPFLFLIICLSISFLYLDLIKESFLLVSHLSLFTDHYFCFFKQILTIEPFAPFWSPRQVPTKFYTILWTAKSISDLFQYSHFLCEVNSYYNV